LFDPKLISPIRNDVKKYSSFEVLECVLKTGSKMMRLSVVYRSTQSKSYEETKMTKFMDEFEDYLDALVGKTGSPIIYGDFNFHV
jgi:exonuclease III